MSQKIRIATLVTTALSLLAFMMFAFHYAITTHAIVVISTFIAMGLFGLVYRIGIDLIYELKPQVLRKDYVPSWQILIQILR